MDYTIEQMEKSMTIVFNKRTGAIKAAIGGIQELDTLFGDEAEDFKLIWSSLIVEKDSYVIDNMQQFKVNTETLGIEILPNALSKYQVAAT